MRKGIAVVLIASMFISLNLSVEWQVRKVMAAVRPRLVGQVWGGGVIAHNGQRIVVRANIVPLFSGGEVRTSGRPVRIRLADGSRLDLLPYGTVAIREGLDGLQAHVAGGRIFFRMGSDARLVLITPTARLEPAGKGIKRGELFVDPQGVSALQMAEGTLRTVERGSDRVLVASADPVFIPERPAIDGPIFIALVIAPTPGLPSGATPIYNSAGENIGYLTSEGTFVSVPGAGPDLAKPMPESALAQVPPDLPAEATAAFTAEGKYVGYLKAGTLARKTEFPGWLKYAAILVGLLAIIGLGAAAGGGGGGGGGGAPPPPPPATP